MRELGAGNRAHSLPPAQFQEFASITEQFNRMSQQIQEREESQHNLNQALAQKNQELESILYISSHDLRTPLVNIAGFSKELEEAVHALAQLAPDSPSKQRLTSEELPLAFAFIHKSLQQMDKLQQGILRISRIDRSEPEWSPVPLYPLLREVLDELQPRLHEMHASYEMGPLPTVLGSPQELRQAFVLLLDNALRYAHPDRALHLAIYASANDHRATIHLQDNGIGIDAPNQAHVFAPFFRVGDLECIAGDGLGLTIAQRIVGRQRGEITLASVAGEGSDFQVHLRLP